jgi:hypothetical protein
MLGGLRHARDADLARWEAGVGPSCGAHIRALQTDLSRLGVNADVRRRVEAAHAARRCVVLDGRCDGCGFEADTWTDAAAVMDLDAMPERSAPVLTGVDEAGVVRSGEHPR